MVRQDPRRKCTPLRRIDSFRFFPSSRELFRNACQIFQAACITRQVADCTIQDEPELTDENLKRFAVRIFFYWAESAHGRRRRSCEKAKGRAHSS